MLTQVDYLVVMTHFLFFSKGIPQLFSTLSTFVFIIYGSSWILIVRSELLASEILFYLFLVDATHWLNQSNIIMHDIIQLVKQNMAI